MASPCKASLLEGVVDRHCLIFSQLFGVTNSAEGLYSLSVTALFYIGRSCLRVGSSTVLTTKEYPKNGCFEAEKEKLRLKAEIKAP